MVGDVGEGPFVHLSCRSLSPGCNTDVRGPSCQGSGSGCGGVSRAHQGAALRSARGGRSGAVSVVVAPVVPGSSAATGREAVVGVGVAVAVVVTFVLAPASDMSLSAVRLESLARVVAVGIPVAAGLYARRRVPFGPLGTLLVASALIWLAVTLSLAGDQALAFSVGRVADSVSWGCCCTWCSRFLRGGWSVGWIARWRRASVCWSRCCICRPRR